MAVGRKLLALAREGEQGEGGLGEGQGGGGGRGSVGGGYSRVRHA